MFDFQKLNVYHKAQDSVKDIADLLADKQLDRVISNQLKRASLSIVLNIAEGSSRFSNKDRRNFLVIARGSAFECVAVMEYLLKNKFITEEIYNHFFRQLEEISKMLYALIKKLE